MLKANGSILTDHRSPLTQWAQAALGLPNVQVQVRLRGNHLHILCEAAECPSAEQVVAQFSSALESTDFRSLLPSQQPRIYQIFVCGRRLGSRQNDWTVKLDCNAARSGNTETTGLLGKKKGDKKDTQDAFEHPTSPPSGRGTEVSVTISEDQRSAAGPRPTAATAPRTIEITAASGLNNAPIPLYPAAPSMTPQPASPQSLATLDVPAPTPENHPAGGTLTLSTERLARRGNPDAIASYLSEVLGPLGVAVRVSLRDLEPTQAASSTPKSTERRLWVLCESVYSPDPTLLATPIAQRLRDLRLEDCRDAVICSQVRGEARPEWLLRVDLTPPDRMLKDWARWGDVAAISRLLNQALAGAGLKARTTLKDSTLHLFCSISANGEAETSPMLAAVPNKQAAMEIVASLLSSIAPQGIRAAAIYGVEATGGEEAPAWIDWRELPAAHHPDLAVSVTTLATEGDRSALTFLINRLLNPNLEQKLKTGGIRAIILPKAGLMHVMTEALACPSQSKVGPPIAQLLRQLRPPGINGVRVYGRRAGQKLPLWRYGVDFPVAHPKAAPLVKPEQTGKLVAFEQDLAPEFAPTPASATLLASVGNWVLNPDIPTDALPGLPRWRPAPSHSGEAFRQAIQRLLIASTFFAPDDGFATPTEGTWPYRRGMIALIGAMAGSFLVYQVDRQVGQFLLSLDRPTLEAQAEGRALLEEEKVKAQESQGQKVAGFVKAEATENHAPLPQLPLEPLAESGEAIFNGSGFTKPGSTQVVLTETCQSGVTGSCNDTPIPINYPTFRSQQLDEQIVRYQDYIRQQKRLPDILIVGSSRALRGIEPRTLEDALAKQGYPGLKVYNFGVNGATVQVVDLIVRQILPPEQLPKLIILADGARAVNSGRVDVTYNAIAASEGYKELARGNFQVRTNQLTDEASKTPAANPLMVVAQVADELEKGQSNLESFLSEMLSEVSLTYRYRQRLHSVLQSVIGVEFSGKVEENEDTKLASELPQDEEKATSEDSLDPKQTDEFEFNGFLPIDLRFDPESYYQKHTKVSGDYDADYQGFQLSGRQTTALENLLEFTKSHDINLVFVNMPLTEEYLDPVRSDHEAKFREHMKQLAADQGLIFRDIALLWPEAREYFSDPSHLNRYGAVEVSQQLAKDPLIPWPVGKREKNH